MPVITRNFYFSLFFMACVLAIGGILFHDSEVGSYVVVGVAFFGGLTLLDILDSRERRRNQGGDGPASS
jgi:uncharacterized membrane protein